MLPRLGLANARNPVWVVKGDDVSDTTVDGKIARSRNIAGPLPWRGQTERIVRGKPVEDTHDTVDSLLN